VGIKYRQKHRNWVPQVLTITKGCKKRDFRQPPPTTATFSEVATKQIPQKLPSNSPLFQEVIALPAKGFSKIKYRKNEVSHAENLDFRHSPPTTAIF
jgi:hypothetical protein